MGLQQSDVLAVVALVVSLVALVTTILQVLQQYFSSAEGYRRCAKSVIGPWAGNTKRKFRASELRYEVIFETPVMFLARPDNEFGPIPKRKINYIDGTKESYKDTKTLEPEQQEVADQQARQRVHTADDERASWVTLLSSIQREERESRDWDKKHLQTPRGHVYKAPEYTLAVGLQPKIRSWDFMPTSVNRPFATTAICHLVELTAVLGMYWKSFEEMAWNLRAEGNGFILTSTLVHGLGLMVTFSVMGKSQFKETRVIPNHDVKDLCFGSVFTIFRNKEAPKTLEFGNATEVNRTLALLGVQKDNMNKYEEKHTHLFSVAHEIIAMLGINFRIRGSNFMRIPNPTTDFWTGSTFSKVVLMEEFQARLKRGFDEKSISPSNALDSIFSHWSRIQKFWPAIDESNFDIDLREALHDALDDSRDYLLTHSSKVIIRVVSSHLNALILTLEELDTALSELDANKEDLFMEHYFTGIRSSVLRSRRKSEAPNASSEITDERNAIWITLIFRMLCWILLHDFHETDIKRVPSELKGSRMPVYIG